MRKSRLNVSWLGRPFSSFKKPAQERLPGLGEQAHMSTALSAARNRAQGDRQDLVKGVQRRIARARVVQTVPACDKAIQLLLPRRESPATR
jgi:hypothetical protein